MLAADPNPKPKNRALCRQCGATPGGCNGLLFVSGRHCCPGCDHHDERPAK